MKRIITIVLVLFLAVSVWAQSPEKMSYQAVVRDAGNVLVTNQLLGMRLSILQGSTAGNAVYEEIQTPTTNTSGLVSLEIGSGIIVSGDFMTIDWVNGPYFIKTETDITGGSAYTITGTSQLMSVPYAFHAKTAESITGKVNYTETDPVFEASIAYSITAADTVNWNNQMVDTDTQLDESAVDVFVANNGYLTSFTEVDGSVTNEIELPITANRGDMSYWDGNAWVVVARTENEGATLQMIGGVPTWVGGTPLLPAIGEAYLGGVLAYVLKEGDPGFETNVPHGLIAAPNDQSAGVFWHVSSTGTTNAIGTALGTGNANTNLIVALYGSENNAANLCMSLELGGYNDWYLPSKDELYKLYENRNAIGGLNESRYWSSSEGSSESALYNLFYNGGGSVENLKVYPCGVRAVRAF